MGKQNTMTKDYMSVPANFADCFNYYLFNGEQVIRAENLEPQDPTELAIIPVDNTGETVEKYRDVLKQCVLMKDDQATYLLLGIENQSNIHYALPVKIMNYDALNYARQVSEIAKEHRDKKNTKNSGEFLSGFTKEDKVKPIFSLVIYFGAGAWDGPRSLKEMFEEVDDCIMDYVEDYKVNLIVPSEITDFHKFATDFGKVMKFIAASEDRDALAKLQVDADFQCIDADAVRLLNACTNSNIKVEEGESKMDMCGGLKALLEEKEVEGFKLRLIKQTEKKIKKGYSAEEIAEMLEEEVSVIVEIMKELEEK